MLDRLLDRLLPASDAVSTAPAGRRAPVVTPTPAALADLDAAAHRALSIQPVGFLPEALFSAFELLGDDPKAVHERVQSIISDQKRMEGHGVQDDVAVSVARQKLAYAAEEYTRAVGAALHTYAALSVAGEWAKVGTASTPAPPTPLPTPAAP